MTIYVLIINVAILDDCSRSYWLMLDTTLDEAAIGLCSDPGSNQMVSGSWAGLSALAGAPTVSLSTSADSSGEWQWPSGTLLRDQFINLILLRDANPNQFYPP